MALSAIRNIARVTGHVSRRKSVALLFGSAIMSDQCCGGGMGVRYEIQVGGHVFQVGSDKGEVLALAFMTWGVATTDEKGEAEG